jgi:transposase-like protein
MECSECESNHIKIKMVIERESRIIYVSGVIANLSTVHEGQRGYSEEVKQECLRMYVNGMGFRGIERMKRRHHTTIINWVKQAGRLLPGYDAPETIPHVGELDELETLLFLRDR